MVNTHHPGRSYNSASVEAAAMVSIDPRDRYPLLAAVVVMLGGNITSYAMGVTMYATVLVAPVAVLAFGLVRYRLHGSPYPVGVRLR